jgi:hypothetical protein
MAKRTQEQKRQDRASIWRSRVTASQKHYEDWERRFRIKDLEKAYYGIQWDESEYENNDYMPYVLNMIFSSIDIKTPSLLFNLPIFEITPKPSRYDFDPQTAWAKARLKSDTLNHFAQGGIKHFASEIEAAILDAWFRFGIIEVGYSADFINNPDAGKPFLLSDEDPLVDADGKVVEQPEVLVESEQIYVRRIPAERFRVGGVDQSALERCSWYGYIDFIRKEDLLASARTNPGYNRDAIKNASGYTPDSKLWNETSIGFYTTERDHLQYNDVVAVWKIWDLRAKRMWMFNYDVSDILYSERFTRIPHFALKFRNMLNGWLPLPTIFNWISPQAEVNETREAARIHRRRFQRKFIVREGAFDEEQLDVLINGADGTFATTKDDPTTAVFPLPSPNLGAQHDQQMAVSRDDFNTITGTSAEMRGGSSRDTATQAQIRERRGEIREARDKEIVATWLCAIGKEILSLAREKMVLPFWIKVSHDRPDLFGEYQHLENSWNLIRGEDLGDDDADVRITVSSMSPVDQVREKNNMNEFLALVTQYPQVAMSPTMIQEIADRTGFRNEKAIAEFVRAAQLLMTMNVVQLAQQTGQDPLQLLMTETFMRNNGQQEGNAVAQRTTAQMTPPDMETIQNQVNNQLTQPQE